MDVLLLILNAFHKAEMEYRGKFVYTIGRIQKFSPMGIIDICYTACRLLIQTVISTLPGFQGPKRYIQYLNSHHHKPIFHPSNYYDGSNVNIFTWSGNQVEEYSLECHQDEYHTRIFNRIRSVSGIIHNLFGVAV